MPHHSARLHPHLCLSAPRSCERLRVGNTSSVATDSSLQMPKCLMYVEWHPAPSPCHLLLTLSSSPFTSTGRWRQLYWEHPHSGHLEGCCLSAVWPRLVIRQQNRPHTGQFVGKRLSADNWTFFYLFFLAGHAHSDWIAQRGSCCGEYLLFQFIVSAKEHGLPVLIGWPRPSRVRFEWADVTAFRERSSISTTVACSSSE